MTETTRSEATLRLLATRRSAKPDLLAEPGPDRAQLEELIALASRVPDHKKLAPWRFIVFTGTARASIGEAFVAACKVEDRMEPSEQRLATERARFMRAPVVVAVVSRVTEVRGAPEWEQVLSAGAAAFNLCLAANAMGYGTSWITEWIAYSPMVRSALGLADNERVAGFVYIGTNAAPQPDRDRPALADIVTWWPQE
ncbi:MAG: nitroreductase [Hyphomicrobiaceae bacterium]|nr:nitroreductase [Hyphomicrobiaceae bacterium]